MQAGAASPGMCNDCSLTNDQAILFSSLPEGFWYMQLMQGPVPQVWRYACETLLGTRMNHTYVLQSVSQPASHLFPRRSKLVSKGPVRRTLDGLDSTRILSCYLIRVAEVKVGPIHHRQNGLHAINLHLLSESALACITSDGRV